MKQTAVLVPIAFIGILVAQVSFGFVVLEDQRGRKTVFVIERKKVVAQPCGMKTITPAQLKMETAKTLLEKCRQDSLQTPALPLSPSEGSYAFSIQSLYQVRGSENSNTAFTDLNSKVIKEEQESDGNTDDRASREQKKLLETLRKVNDEIIIHLGSESHRIIRWEEELGAYYLVQEALNPVYFDGSRFWMVSSRVTPDKMDEACPIGWAPASADVILNSRYFSDIATWFGKYSEQVLTWYRWQEPRFIAGNEAWVPSEWSVVLIFNKSAIEWDYKKNDPVPISGTKQRVNVSLPGIGKFIYTGGNTNTNPRFMLCTRTFVLSPTAVPPSKGTVELKVLASGTPLARIVRWSTPVPDVEAKLSERMYWNSPVDPHEWSRVASVINDQLGTGLPSPEGVRASLIASARSEISRLEPEITELNNRVAKIEERAGPYLRSLDAPNYTQWHRDGWSKTAEFILATARPAREESSQKQARVQQLRKLLSELGAQ